MVSFRDDEDKGESTQRAHKKEKAVARKKKRNPRYDNASSAPCEQPKKKRVETKLLSFGDDEDEEDCEDSD